MFSVLLSIYLGVSHTVNSMLKFLRNRQTIFHSSSPFYIPTNNISPPPTLGVFHFLFFSFFWLCWVFTAAHGLSLVAATLDCGAWASHCGGFSSWSMSSRHSGFSSCSMRAQQLWCAGFSSCGARASVVEVCGLSSCGAWALGCTSFSSCGAWALEHRISSCGTRAQLLHGMWDLPGPGIEPMSPALAGGFLTIAPPGKSFPFLFLFLFLFLWPS